jgi:hypothetical protein
MVGASNEFPTIDLKSRPSSSDYSLVRPVQGLIDRESREERMILHKVLSAKPVATQYEPFALQGARSLSQCIEPVFGVIEN